MIVMKKSLSRRTVLRGLGATVALPLLDSMVPALSATAQTVAAPVPRLAFFYVPNGTFPKNFHPSGNGGSGFDLTPVLQPLADFRDQLTVVTGLSNSGVLSPNEGGGVHTRAHGGWLNGVLPTRTEGADIQAGKTIDQYAADKLGADTSLRSLELTTESNYAVGNCENGYSCAYRNSTSWLTPTTPLPHERDPRVVFQRLFGDGGSVEARINQMKTDRSILDSVTQSIQRLEGEIGAQDRATVDEYLQSVREIERRIQRTEKNNSTTPLPQVDQPMGVPDDYDEHVGLLQDMLVLAFRADVTRVSCMQMARETRVAAELISRRPIEALNSIWIEELTWMEVRDLLQPGTKKSIISTGGIEQNGPYLAPGKQQRRVNIFFYCFTTPIFRHIFKAKYCQLTLKQRLKHI